MSANPRPYRLHLFTLRLWQEVVDGEQWEWRGEVKNSATGATRYFRDFQYLSELLPLLLSDGPAEPNRELSRRREEGQLFSYEQLMYKGGEAMSTTVIPLEAGVYITNRAFEVAFARGDAAGAAAAYTTSGQAFPPNAAIISGRAALQTYWQGVMNSGVKNVTLETLELFQGDDLAYEIGQAVLYGEGDTILDTAKYMVIWQEQFGQWKWHRDIWNSNTPAQP